MFTFEQKHILLAVIVTSLVAGSLLTNAVLLYTSKSESKPQTVNILQGGTIYVGTNPCSYQIFIISGTTYAQSCNGGAILDSSTDAAGVIDDAIGNLTSGGKIFIKAGTYTLTTSIVTYNISHIELSGEGNATLLQAATNMNGDAISVFNSNNWYIHDLQVNGNRAQQSGAGQGGGYDGIALYNSNDSVVEHTYVHDDKTYGIFVRGTDIKVLNNYVVNNNANGIIAYGLSNYLIEGNTVNGASDVGISISGVNSTLPISGVICTGNTILNINMGVSPYGQNSGDGIITGDNGNANNITVSNNYIDVAYIGMWIGSTQGLIVSDNTIIPTATVGWGIGIVTLETESAIIQSNLISEASHGIYIYNSTTSTVQFLDNTITSTGTPTIITNSAPVIIKGNVGYNPVKYISSPISGSSIVDSGSSSTWTSSMTYTNWQSPKVLYLSGGTVTAIVVDGQTLYTAATSVSITLQPGDTFSVTFSVAPTIKVFGQ